MLREIEELPKLQKARKTFRQDWQAYNAAQTHEKDHFLQLLQALCASVQDPAPQTNGRPRLPIGDVLFACCYKVYSTVSARRFMSDLRSAHAKGLISKAPHYNSIYHYLDDPALTPLLQDLIVRSSEPLADVEKDFAADSSGFTGSVYERWFSYKYGKKQAYHQWSKIHLMCGVKTHIISAAEIREKYTHDSTLLPDLVATTAKTFDMREVSGDKAYGSYKNYDAIQAAGAVPFINFRSDHKGTGISSRYGKKPHALWSQMFHYFKFHEQEFLAHYHKRSNVEATFSMMKAKFGGNLRSKTKTAMRNECLCKAVCHNICVLIQAAYEIGLEIPFLQEGW